MRVKEVSLEEAARFNRALHIESDGFCEVAGRPYGAQSGPTVAIVVSEGC